jgi:hypothetical protein
MSLANHIENLSDLSEKDLKDLATALIQSITVKVNEPNDSLTVKRARIKELISFLEKYLNEHVLDLYRTSYGW